MTRALRFRAWDTKEKAWIANGDVMDLNYCARYNSFLFDNDNYDLDKNTVLVQSTGIKDREGREIFEGDILDVRNWGRTDEVLGRVEVIWDVDDKGWRYRPNLGHDTYDCFRNVEIIGNIYANPDLLTDRE